MACSLDYASKLLWLGWGMGQMPIIVMLHACTLHACMPGIVLHVYSRWLYMVVMVLLTPLGPISLVDVCVWVSVAICVIVGVVSACTHVALEVPSTSRGQSYHTPRLCTGYLLLCNWGAPAYISVSNDYLIHIVLTGICYQLFILCVFSTRTHTRSRAGVWENPESPTRSAWAQAEVAAQPPVQPLSKVHRDLI